VRGAASAAWLVAGTLAYWVFLFVPFRSVLRQSPLWVYLLFLPMLFATFRVLVTAWVLYRQPSNVRVAPGLLRFQHRGKEIALQKVEVEPYSPWWLSSALVSGTLARMRATGSLYFVSESAPDHDDVFHFLYRESDA